MIFGLSSKSRSINIFLDEEPLEEVESVQFLDLTIDRGLTWADHIDKLCCKIASGFLFFGTWPNMDVTSMY